VISLAGKIRGVGHAIDAASDLAKIAEDESGAASTERDAPERQRLKEVLGADPTARTHPPHIRSQLAALEKEQKARATRYSRDVLDRSLLDLLSIYRDALVLHTGAPIDLVNQDAMAAVQQLAQAMSPEELLHAIDAIGTARERIGLNVNPLLALEAMALSLRLPS
jgi:DNA polymerase-3 subunit delta'